MMRFLHNLFIPHHFNNYRSKLLHNSSLVILIAFLVVVGVSASFIQHKYPNVLGISYSISENEMLSQINGIRQGNNLSPLSLNQKLSSAASGKASDMLSKNYWAHFAPDGSTSPWQFIKGAGYNYLYAGENLAKGFTNSSDVVTAWMNSPTHRDNILSSKYKDIGFAIVEGKLQGEDTVLVVEMFGATTYPVIANQPEVKLEEVAKPAQEVQKPKEEPVKVVQEPNLLGKNANLAAVVPKTNSVITKPKVDLSITSKSISLFILSLLIFAFIMDFVIVERSKIPRIVGHNLDHIMLVILFALLIVMQRTGGIL